MVINPWEIRKYYLEAIKQTKKPAGGISPDPTNSGHIAYYTKVSETLDKLLEQAGIPVERMPK